MGKLFQNKNKTPRFDCSGTSGDNAAKIHFFWTFDYFDNIFEKKTRNSLFHKTMKYEEYETAFAAARLNKYLYACGGNKAKALQLYRLNIKLCQKLYGVLNVFEIVLRNAIHNHYESFFSDANWIKTQLSDGGMLSAAPMKTETISVIRKLDYTGKYTPDRAVSSLSLGFWTYLFTKYPFAKGGKSILKIFPNKTKPLGQRAVFNELQIIKRFRNRIAHHEPICFDNEGHINTTFANENYKLIIRYLHFLGYNDEQILLGLNVRPYAIFKKIEGIARMSMKSGAPAKSRDKSKPPD